MANKRENSRNGPYGRLGMTKKEKLDATIDEKERLLDENSYLRRKLHAMERDVQNLKQQLVFILKNDRRNR